MSPPYYPPCNEPDDEPVNFVSFVNRDNPLPPISQVCNMASWDSLF